MARSAEHSQGFLSRAGSSEVQMEDGSVTPPEHTDSRRPGDDNDSQAAAARAKRIACVICRKRKLRCDGVKPSCGTCSRLNHPCGYDEVRKKSGPKRGYVKELEARLAQVETQLRSKTRAQQGNALSQISQPPMRLGDRNMTGGMADQDMMTGFANVTVDPSAASARMVPDVTVTSDVGGNAHNGFPWEVMSLGLEEPLPPQDMIDEMHGIYFEKLAASFPMIHKYRYLAAMNLAPHMRPAICLRYAIWALACSVTDKYFTYSDMFYQRARKYAEADEMKGHGESFITVGHAQCWVLVTMFEFKMLYFPRAWMSAGRCSRLAMMLGLHRQDGTGLEVKQVLPPARDWTDKEERRRTFWAAYCNDRYASIGTGWPMTIDECDILTNLPVSMDAYEKSVPQDTTSLADAMTPEGATNLSSFAGVVLLACLFGKNLTHLHRSTDTDHPDDPSGEFWKRHHKLDSILMTTSMFLPDHLRLPAGMKDANVVFLNMNIYSATICLHQAAILKAERHNLSTRIIKESTDRCFLAAGEIVTLMRLVSQVDLSTMNPFISFCLYVAARIYAHAYKKRPQDESIRSNLDFLLITMQAHRKKNPITESFLVQVMVELDAAGLNHTLYRKDPTITKDSETLLKEGDNCPPVFQAHSSTQPSFHELQQGSVSPVASNATHAASHSSGSGVHSPQPRYQSSFAVSNRERSGSLHPQQQTGIVQNQVWNDQNFSEAQTAPRPVFTSRFDSINTDMQQEDHTEHTILTPAHSHRASSHASYSPQPQVQEHDPMVQANAPVSDSYYNQQVPYQDYNQGSAFSTQPPTSNGNFSMAPDWDMQHPMEENEWSQVLEGIGWEEPGTIPANMESWRSMNPGVNNGH